MNLERNTMYKIRLNKNTKCSQDIHETTNYPRPWYKEKPELSQGTILEVEKEFGNFYGLYYKCKLPENLNSEDYTIPWYDIKLEDADEI